MIYEEEVEVIESVWEDIANEFEIFCKANGGRIDREEEFGEESIICTFPEPRGLYVSSKLFPNGKVGVKIEDTESYASFLIPEDFNVYVDNLVDSESKMSVYSIMGRYAEYTATPKKVRKVEIIREKRRPSKTIFIVFRE
ncbi:MAG TPA: hypothetical protein ENG66_02530 [Thermococcus sp.]|nr:MAG: hypothetical protein DRN63_04590 [Nanoarchaeota archaeon]HDH44267.1 hypothetical protein [Thermococcus sp.]